MFPPTPECSTQDLRVEAFLVFADLWGVAVGSDVGRVDVDHRDLSGFVQPGLLLPQQLISKHGWDTIEEKTDDETKKHITGWSFLDGEQVKKKG